MQVSDHEPIMVPICLAHLLCVDEQKEENYIHPQLRFYERGQGQIRLGEPEAYVTGKEALTEKDGTTNYKRTQNQVHSFGRSPFKYSRS